MRKGIAIRSIRNLITADMGVYLRGTKINVPENFFEDTDINASVLIHNRSSCMT